MRHTHRQWRRSDLKSGGQGHSGQAIKLFQIVNDLQTRNNPDSCQRVGALKKLVLGLPSVFDINLSFLLM